jgi:CRP/FNR family transcriptional regulator, nitrogen oxide reductase regulator
MMQLDIRQLQNNPMFHGVNEDDLRVILDVAQFRDYEEDNFIFYQDDSADCVCVVLEGRIKLTQLSLDGQQVIMRVATPGMLIGAIGLVEGALFPVSAQAAEPTRIMYWTQAELLKLLERFPVLALNGMRLMAGHVREFQDRYRELATERVERRLARTILRLANQTGRKIDEGVLLDLPLTRQDLAEMTGTTLFTVSRIFTKWEADGLVAVGRERVVIRFPHGLVRIAEDLPPPPGTGENS